VHSSRRMTRYPAGGFRHRDSRSRPFANSNGKIRTKLLAKLATGTAFGLCQVRITPFIGFQGMGRTESYAVSATLAPRGIYTHLCCFRLNLFFLPLLARHNDYPGPCLDQKGTTRRTSFPSVYPAAEFLKGQEIPRTIPIRLEPPVQRIFLDGLNRSMSRMPVTRIVARFTGVELDSGSAQPPVQSTCVDEGMSRPL